MEEIKALNEAYAEIQAVGGDMIAISPQIAASTERQMNEGGIQFSILVDENNSVGKAFQLVYEFPDDLRRLYESVFKLDIANKNGVAAWELPIPARFVVDQSGTVLDVKADPDYRFRPEAQDAISILKSLAGGR